MGTETGYCISNFMVYFGHKGNILPQATWIWLPSAREPQLSDSEQQPFAVEFPETPEYHDFFQSEKL